MMVITMNNDNILNLYEHNEEISSKVFDAFNKDEKRVAIVQATGTGKSYVALNLLLKYKDKKALYIVPSNAIIEHLKEIIRKNNLSIEKDFPNLEFRTYQSLINLSKEELSKLNVDLDNVTLGIPSSQFTTIKHQLDERECRASKFYIPVDADSFKLSGITVSRNQVDEE